MEKNYQARELLFKNLANLVTIFGLLLTIWLLIIAITNPNQLWLMLLLVGLIGLTDLLDGKIARHLRSESNLGKLLDGLRDKIFVCSFLIILSWRYLPSNNQFPIFIAFTRALILSIILIELLISLVGLVGMVKKLDIVPNKFGKIKMFFEFLVIISWLTALTFEKYLEFPVFSFSIYLINLILIAILYLAVKSLDGYYQKYLS